MQSYIFLLLIVIILAFLSTSVTRKARPYFFFLNILVLLFFSSLRYDVGTDFNNYISILHRVNEESIYNASLEVVFKLIFKVVALLDSPEPLMVVVTSLLSVITIILGLNNYLKFAIADDRRYAFVCIIFLLQGLFFLSLNGIRQSIAIGFILLFLSANIQRKPKQMIVYSMLAIGFHWFSVIVPLSVLVFNRFKNILIVAGVVFVPITFMLGKFDLIRPLILYVVEFLPEKYSYSPEHFLSYNSGYSAKLLLDNIMVVGIVLFLLNNKDKVIRVYGANQLYWIKLTCFLCLIAVNLSNLGTGVRLILRAAYYFQIFIPVLLFFLTCRVKYHIGTAFVLLLYLLVYFRMLMGNFHEVIPYSSWL